LKDHFVSNYEVEDRHVIREGGRVLTKHPVNYLHGLLVQIIDSKVARYLYGIELPQES
jgi:hypothetical protein